MSESIAAGYRAFAAAQALLGRAIGVAKQLERVDIYRAAANGSGMAQSSTNVPAWLVVPHGDRALRVLAELGGARATWVGELPWNANVLEGDELRSAGRAWVVERVVSRSYHRWCALSEIRL